MANKGGSEVTLMREAKPARLTHWIYVLAESGTGPLASDIRSAAQDVRHFRLSPNASASEDVWKAGDTGPDCSVLGVTIILASSEQGLLDGALASQWTLQVRSELVAKVELDATARAYRVVDGALFVCGKRLKYGKGSIGAGQCQQSVTFENEL
jgi:hypothetical protein